jgi:hypothetical protein
LTRTVSVEVGTTAMGFCSGGERFGSVLNIRKTNGKYSPEAG